MYSSDVLLQQLKGTPMQYFFVHYINQSGNPGIMGISALDKFTALDMVDEILAKKKATFLKIEKI